MVTIPTGNIELPLGRIPQGLADRSVPLTDNSRIVMSKRYVRRDHDGSPAETINETFWRVASNVAAGELPYSAESAPIWAEKFFDLLAGLRFLPNSPTFTGAGTPLGNLSACFVLPISDDMGKEESGIFQTLRDAALIQQTGGGNGFSFSRLRSKGTLVKSSNGQATGPIGFLKAYDQAFGIINQGGARRGANMGVLRVDHPDVRDFITSKTNETQITNFNISVAITDKFMQAVIEDGDYDLIEPSTGQPRERIRAREIFDLIAKQAHHNGEPGVLFIDAANRSNPIPHIGHYEATNPCVTGDTRIYTDRGLVRAVELFQQGQPTAVAVDGRFGVSSATTPATSIFLTGVKPVFKLQTKEGYTLRATADHRIMTERGWVEMQALQPGDQVHILNRKGGFGTNGSEALGRVLGWLVGDGTIKSDAVVLSFFGDEKRELAPLFADYVDTLVAPRTLKTRAYTVGVVDVPTRDEARVSSERLRQIAAEHGLTADKHQVPEQVFQGSEAMQRGFLQGLFSADGSLHDRETIRLEASRLSLLEDVQRLLLNFGIASRIESDALHISGANAAVFTQEIGLRLEHPLTSLDANQREYFTATVAAVIPDGEEAVYDLTEPVTHSFIAGGVVVHNCGEQWLLGYESCNLGSINLALHVTPDGRVDWELLQTSIEESTRFLDDVVEVNRYVDAVPQLREAALRSRRIGLGFMGLADMMILLNLRYGSPEGQEFAAQISEFVRYHAMRTSIALAQERGAFPAIKGSIYDADQMTWQPPQPLVPYSHDWARPAVDWEGLVADLRRYGIRNAAQTTIAPTGTISTVSGCEGYGCEPVFALAYTRYVVDGDSRFELSYGSPLLQRKLEEAGFDAAEIQAIIDQVQGDGGCQNVMQIPAQIRHALVVSGDVTPEEHVRMQASIQAFIDNSISKTINMPATATVDDVQTAYRLAWELGCKGLTVYVTGSRDVVVLETKSTRAAREGQPAEAAPAQPAPVEQYEHKKPRPIMLQGRTYRMPTPVGTGYLTINENGHGHGQPFEVFINTSKAGSEIAAISEAMGRLISLTLRLTSPISPRDRVHEIVKQFSDIGGGRQMGFGPNRVASLPDAIARILKEYLMQTDMEGVRVEAEAAPLLGAAEPVTTTGQRPNAIGDICPECGSATLIRKEGCVSCHECGYSEC